MSESKSAAGTSPFFVVFLVFLVLKLTGTVDWSWWAVTAPLWAPPLILLAMFLFVGGIALIAVAAAPVFFSIFMGAVWLFERVSKFFKGLTR